MSGRICTYHRYLTQSTDRSDRFFGQLFGSLKGYSVLLGWARTSLQAVDHTLVANGQPNDRLQDTIQYLNGAKTVISIARSPEDMESFCRRASLVYTSLQKTYTHWKLGESLDFNAGMHTALAICQVMHKFLSLLGQIIVQPLILMNQRVHNQELQKALDQWSYISLAKSGLKVCCLGGQLAVSSDRRFFHSIKLALESCSIVFSSLKLARIPLNPFFNLALSSAKSLFDIYNIWLETE